MMLQMTYLLALIFALGLLGLMTNAAYTLEPPPVDARETAEANFDAASAAWTKKDFPAVRASCASVLEAQVPVYLKSYAQLRIAQSYLTETNYAAAKAEYASINANVTYPDVHRFEAAASIKEIDRTLKGLPARDPLASRTTIPAVTPAVEFFVATTGRDNNPGTRHKPFATLARARAAVREVKAAGLPAGGVAVTIKPGEYPMQDTFVLTAEDSGTEGSPIVYRAEKKGTVVFYGGTRLAGFAKVIAADILARLPEDARGKVYQCDLRALGITDYGEEKVHGFGIAPSPPTMELYSDGKPMTVARWPNKGFVNATKLIEPGVRGQKPSVFGYDSDRPARWSQAEDPWIFGYFKYLWADAALKVAKIDTTAKTITTSEAYSYGGSDGGMSMEQAIVYYAYNLLEEIDTPGEWYLDRTRGMLYFWPPTNPSKATIETGRFSSPMLTMDNVADVRLDGLVFDLARSNGIILTDCTRCLIAACTVKRFAGNGISIIGGKQCGILGSDIHTIGRRATEVIGGDRATLTPGGHFVENCQIHNFGRIDRTYTPAIQLEGVGNRVAHNLMYDCPSSVMRIEGNDHLIEFNEVHSALQESDDQGTMELFANPSYRGVIFRYNLYYNNGKTGDGSSVSGGAAIRFDDVISGMSVYGNIFVRSANGGFGAIQINSGRDNIIDNNIFVECKQAISGGWNRNNKVWDWASLPGSQTHPDIYQNDLYLTRYPAIAHMLDTPGVNYLWRNVFYHVGSDASQLEFESLANSTFNLTDPGFVNAAKGDFRLRKNAALFAQMAFKPIPTAEIGLYADAHRASWPVHTTPVTMPNWYPISSRPTVYGDAKLSADWTVFATLERTSPLPMTEQLARFPDKLLIDGKEIAPIVVKVPDGKLDLGKIIGGTAEGKTAWLYIPFETRTGGKTTLGFGADWWLQAWIDGQLVCDTTAKGNVDATGKPLIPASATDHLVTLDLAPGAHLAVVRFASGSSTSLFAAGGAEKIQKTWADAHWWLK